MDERPPTIDLGADVRAQLDHLAGWVADRLERDDEAAAWRATVAAETLADPSSRPGRRPPGPVIGRRFAAAHRRLLAAETDRRATGAGRPAA